MASGGSVCYIGMGGQQMASGGSVCYIGMGGQQMASGGSVRNCSPSETGSLPRRLKSSDCFIVYSLLHVSLIITNTHIQSVTC